MYDLSNPYLTQQSKKDMIAIDVSDDYKNEKIEQQQRGNPFGSSSYWLVSAADLRTMNEASCKTDSFFNFYDEMLEELNPTFDILLLEHDSVKKGEYDTFMNRWSTYSYTNVCAVAVNGYFKYIPFDDREQIELELDFGGSELYKGNREHLHQERGIWGLGVIDIPQDVLDNYEENRVYRRTYAFSKMFEQGMNNVFAGLKKTKAKMLKKTVKRGINKRRFNKGFGI